MTNNKDMISYPQDRHDRVTEALRPVLDGVSASCVTHYDVDGFVDRDASPHSFLQLIPPALKLSNYLPTFDLEDSPSNERKERKLNKLAKEFASTNNLKKLINDAILDAAAYGVSYLVCYEDGIKQVAHDMVEFWPDWANASKVKITHNIVVGDEVVVMTETYDLEAQTVTRAQGDQIETYPHEMDVLPIIRLAFGDSPSDANYPYGLILPWLPILDELNYYRGLLKLNVTDSLLAPTFLSDEYLKDSERGIEIEYYGHRVIAVPDSFFASQGGSKIFRLPPSNAPAEMYQHISNLNAKLNEVSHMSDLLRSQQLRAGITAAEVKAIQASSTLWLSTQREIVKDFVESVWRIWAEYEGIDAPLTLEIPDVDTSSQEEKLKKAQFLLSLTQSPLAAKLNIDELLFEVATLLGVSSIIKEEDTTEKVEPTKTSRDTQPVTSNSTDFDSRLSNIVGQDNVSKVKGMLEQMELLDQAEKLNEPELLELLNRLIQK